MICLFASCIEMVIMPIYAFKVIEYFVYDEMMRMTKV